MMATDNEKSLARIGVADKVYSLKELLKGKAVLATVMKSYASEKLTEAQAAEDTDAMKLFETLANMVDTNAIYYVGGQKGAIDSPSVLMNSDCALLLLHFKHEHSASKRMPILSNLERYMTIQKLISHTMQLKNVNANTC